MKSVSVVLPVYNEEENILDAINEAISVLEISGLKYEIIVVDDGSSDRTPEILKKVSEGKTFMKIITHPMNLGYGVALRDSFSRAKHELIFFTDSDRQFDMKALIDMLPLIDSQNVDIVIGYRINRKDPLIRRFLSWGFNTLVGFMFDLNVKDIDCAFKLFKREIFDEIKIESERFFVNTEILVKARRIGYNIVEVGVRHFPRTAGKTTVSFKCIPFTLIELWRMKRKLKK